MGVALLISARLASADDGQATPRWIWRDKAATLFFRKEITIPEGVKAARLVATCDNEVALFLDGKPVLQSSSWEEPVSRDVSKELAHAGRHILAAQCKDQGGAAGFLARLTFETDKGVSSIVTDNTWKVAEKASRAWREMAFDDTKWEMASVVGTLGDGPWVAVTKAAIDNAANPKSPSATSPDKFKVAKGFKVELLYTVPKDEQGSWVSMTTDPKGRLIVADQYGKLYRVTPPPIGKTEGIKVEPIDVEIGEAQGLLWAFDGLYVVVNQGQKYRSGLYKVTDTNNDDRLDKVELLRPINGGGEHGPHAVLLSPDGKSLYVIAGNATTVPKLSGSLVPQIWDEDQILPYMPDGRGFMRDERAPGGWICKVTPDGKDWTLVSMGYRNPYDMAFNKYGDLFTYDSDMEWDINLPWYRPTRVCLAAPGSDLGYRNGSGKWPTYYPDSLPPVVNIGPGSPTGVCFGYGAKFPPDYQEALYICDWSYGKLYAVHMSHEQGHYKALLDEFITGTPLPLTDIVVNPKDGAMYFTIGGRRTLSGLYRVTYQWSPNDPSTDNFPVPRGELLRRKSLEDRLANPKPDSLEVAWSHLNDPDRYTRFAARSVIEKQPRALWLQKALDEANPEAAITALLALSRSGDQAIEPMPFDAMPREKLELEWAKADRALQSKIFDALARIDWDKLDVSQKLELLRVYEVAIARMGVPSGEIAQKVIARLDPYVPAKARELNSELCKILIALQAPSAASKTMALLAHAPTQEEQIDLATALRMLKAGWTSELRKAYFSWFLAASQFKGGPSLEGFIKEIKDDALKTLSSDEMASLKPIIDAKPQGRGAVATAPARPFVKAWTVDELAPLVEANLKHRDFDKGRTQFAATSCFNCHRYDNEGGIVGPDLTGVAGRFSPRDLLESIILPSKSVSDQYQAVSIATTDGRVITGRIMNLNGDGIILNTNMLDPSAQVTVNRKQIEEMKPSPVSMMPEGLLNSLNKEEIFDMLAYLLSRGDRNSLMFK